ncbi:uncharacterized protein C11orf52 homolog [Saccopteryx leptura]|uniref:uncharacterized protein C11orf52 homolog n=1 Tax=Saccopteryx leptura TaxID=249018 RepID=UPI00339C8FF5
MGNLLCCRGSWSCPSYFQRKKKMGSPPRWTLRRQQQQMQTQQNGTKGHDTTVHTCEWALEQPADLERSQSLRSEDNSLHYAVIQVCGHTQPRSAQELQHRKSENAIEYTTLSFPQAYDCKNGTLV